MQDGHLNKCKDCAKRDVRNNYIDKFDQYQKYEQLREQRPGRKQKKLVYQQRRRAREPIKNLARSQTLRAIATGKLKRLPCQKCGDKNSQAHHTDYTKPLEVEWLCFKCHRKEHGQLIHEKR